MVAVRHRIDGLEKEMRQRIYGAKVRHRIDGLENLPQLKRQR